MISPLKNHDKLTWFAFNISFLILPFLKVLTGAFNLLIPIYYLPIFATLPVILIRFKKINLSFFLLNLFIITYIILGLAANNGINITGIKLYSAALLYFNSAYALFTLLNTDIFYSQFITTQASIIKKLAYVFLFICFLSFVINLFIEPIAFTRKDLLNFLTFDRSSNIFRYQVLLRFNPVGFLTNNVANIRYIGQQLLLLPLVAYVISYCTNNLKKTENLIFLAILLISAYIVNSRGMCLAVIILTVLTTFKSVPAWLHKFYTVTAASVPIGITFISKSSANGRLCQLEFTKDHLSFFGNGVGSYIHELNNRCSEISNSSYTNIITISFDNIHLEAVHYFGALNYLIAILFTVAFLFKNNNLQSRILTFVVFIFLTLNFNLFEFILLPGIIYLAHSSKKKHITN